MVASHLPLAPWVPHQPEFLPRHPGILVSHPLVLASMFWARRATAILVKQGHSGPGLHSRVLPMLRKGPRSCRL